MSHYSKGTAFECTIRKLFEDAGFSVIRGAGSKGTLLKEKVDLVATRLTPQNEQRVMLTIIGCQCKVRAR